MLEYRAEGLCRNANHLSREELSRCMASGEVLQSTALAYDTGHRLRFELGGLRGIMPFADCVDAAPGETVKDIAVLTRVGRPTCFVIMGTEFDENGEEYEDNGERAIFFARGVLETVKKLRWSPEVIHCQGWMGYIVPLFIKTAYKDEPTFAGTKIVTSIFSQGLTKKIGDNFKRCLEFKDITEESLSDYKDDFDFIEMCKLAIDHSDAVVEAEADAYPELIEYAKSKGIEVLPYSGEGANDAYKAFYESL